MNASRSASFSDAPAPAGPRRAPLLAALIVFLPALAGCLGSFSYPDAEYDTRALRFEGAGNTLAATLNLPRNPGSTRPPLLIFVHGDGALPADAYGYYAPMWNRLARHGIASAAWDKPGVGDSTGNWLHQSMAARATEVIDAVEYLRASASDAGYSSVGLIGFSQAGWVLPEVAARRAGIDFMIMVSGAVDWRGQSDYLTRRRLEGLGFDEPAIEAALAQNALDLARFDGPYDYDDYLRHERDKCRRDIEPSGCDPMPRDRFRFVRTNVGADASDGLMQIDLPVLALFGDSDRNVDVEESRTAYRRLVPMPPTAALRIETYPDATHGLLRVEHFDDQEPGLAFLTTLARMGEAAFADGVLDDIVDFALDPTIEDDRAR